MPKQKRAKRRRIGARPEQDAERLKSAERRTQCVSQRIVLERTWQEISDALAYGSASNARRDFLKALDERGPDEQQVAEARQEEILRLKRLRARIAPKAYGGRIGRDGKPAEPDMAAAATYLRFTETIARFAGTYAPKVVELGGPGGGPLTVVAAQASPADAARLVREAFGKHAAMRQLDVGGEQQSGNEALVADASDRSAPPDSGDLPKLPPES